MGECHFSASSTSRAILSPSVFCGRKPDGRVSSRGSRVSSTQRIWKRLRGISGKPRINFFPGGLKFEVVMRLDEVYLHKQQMEMTNESV